MYQKVISVILLFFTSFSLYGQERTFFDNTDERKCYVHISCPNIFFTSDQSWLEGNLLQGYGAKVEYKGLSRLSCVFGFYHNYSNLKYPKENSWQIVKSLDFNPALRLYLDPYTKLFVSVGDKIRFCYEEKGSQTKVESMHYQQNIVDVGIGYKMYFLKKRRFGIEVYAGSNVIVWGNSESWTSALSNRGITADFSLFYKF